MFESQESIRKRATETVNNKFDPKFNEKFEKVKPVLDKYKDSGTYERTRQMVEKNRAEAKAKIEAIQKELGIFGKTPEEIIAAQRGEAHNQESFGEAAPVSSLSTGQPRSLLDVELDMFKPENMKDRAMNRVEVMKNSKGFKEQVWSEKALQVLRDNGMELPAGVKLETQKLDTPEERAKNRVNIIKNSKDYVPQKWTERAKDILKRFDNWKGFSK